VSGPFVGIDVGARWLHCAALDEHGHVLDRATLPAEERAVLAAWCDTAQVVAIDAPEAPSTTPHAAGTELAPKFRAARCAEIALGREHGIWVPWVAPAAPPFPAWMETGFAVYRALGRPGGPLLAEVYPYAGFLELADGRRPARKQTAAGRAQRAGLLARAGVRGAVFNALSHDELDALLAALIAMQRSRGLARRVSCGHDDSAIWLPARPVPPPAAG
jgi:predicted nuclease with RNAse H fold